MTKNLFRITDINGRFLCVQGARDRKEALDFAKMHNKNARFAELVRED